MNDKCEICLNKKCDVVGSCDCDGCGRAGVCYRQLSPTVRITTQCTQECAHCCFSCSPSKTDMMSVEMAKSINAFCLKNKISKLNVMGGEFFCNPDWVNIVDILSKDMTKVRLVTNSDWFVSEDIKKNILDLFGKNKTLYFALSYDDWHTNRYVDTAARWLDENDISFQIENWGEAQQNTILPLGRAETNYIGTVYDIFSAYCRNPNRLYSFLIVENGNIYACPLSKRFYLGNVEDDLYTFRSTYAEKKKPIIDNIMSCGQCNRLYMFTGQTKKDGVYFV